MPWRDLRPTSMLKTQWLLHLRSRASPSRPIMLLSVVFTERPSKCSQSMGAGLFRFGAVEREARGKLVEEVAGGEVLR